MSLGTLVFDDRGRRGLFIGYDDYGRKMAISDHDLTDFFKRNFIDYKVRVEIIKEKQPLRFSRWLANIVPGSIKEAIKNEI